VVGFEKQVGFKPGVKERRSYGWAEWWVKRGRSDGWRNMWVWNGGTGTRIVEWSWRRDIGSRFQRQGEAQRKERSVIFREDDVGGRARVTTDEERVLRGRW